LGTASDSIRTIINEFPASARSAIILLPTPLLSPKPLYELLNGFKTDLEFPRDQPYPEAYLEAFPIRDEDDLEIYANRVAGTVAELCLELVFHHCSNPTNISQKQREYLVSSGGRMGIALQYVNIARDIETDAAIGRVYIPTSLLAEEGLTPQAVIENPNGKAIGKFRPKLLGKAFNIYEEAKCALAKLPREARAPMRVAVESYMEIGRVLGEKGYKVKAGRATVPKMRRIGVAWKALNEG
jgi:15-cis-phytoene synthase/lycopene beta-cyclase